MPIRGNGRGAVRRRYGHGRHWTRLSADQAIGRLHAELTGVRAERDTLFGGIAHIVGDSELLRIW